MLKKISSPVNGLIGIGGKIVIGLPQRENMAILLQ